MNENFSELVFAISLAIIAISLLLGKKSGDELEKLYIEKGYCKTYNIQASQSEWLPCAQIKRK